MSALRCPPVTEALQAQKLVQKILVLEPNNEQAKVLWQNLQKM